MHFDLRKIQHVSHHFDFDFIKMIHRYAINCNKVPATVGKIVNGKYTTEYDKWCTAKFVEYEMIENQMKIIKDKCQLLVEKKYSVKCLDSEVHFLYYDTGSKYKAHIDGQYIENNVAIRGVDRDITCVVYLNSDYSGGEINFNFFNYSVKPNTGDILIYPSSWEYTHSVSSVHGERYAIVFWFKTNPELNVNSELKDQSVIKFLSNITS